jgi:hypothetical protein
MTDDERIAAIERANPAVCAYVFSNRMPCHAIEGHATHRGEWRGIEGNHEYVPGLPVDADIGYLLARLREVELELDRWAADSNRMQNERDRTYADWEKMSEQASTAMAERDAARAREKRAYTLLVSVQPAAKRQERDSINETALRLHRILVDAIQEWVDEYLAAHDEAAR